MKLAALIDLSGTIHVGDTCIGGAVSALSKLRQYENKVAVKFVTNTTKESHTTLFNRLQRLGFTLNKHEMFTSMLSAESIVKSRQLRPLLMIAEDAKQDFLDVDCSDPNSVVVGLAPDQFNYTRMNEAFSLLQQGVPLIAIHKGRYYRNQKDLCLGPGPFITALEYASGVQAEVVGKPEKAFFLEAIKDLGVSPEQCIMIGDDVRDDVHGSQEAGMRGILVKTGKYREGDEHLIDPPPFRVCQDFSAAVDEVLKLLE